MTVEAYVHDNIEADVESGMTVRRGTVEIQTTRRGDDGKADPNEVPPRRRQHERRD